MILAEGRGEERSLAHSDQGASWTLQPAPSGSPTNPTRVWRKLRRPLDGNLCWKSGDRGEPQKTSGSMLLQWAAWQAGSAEP